MLFLSMLRFWWKGWIRELYMEPGFFFSYYGFEWVKPIGVYTPLLFAICGVAALCVAIGLWYRWSSILLFLSFSYIELMDKTTYLNHYYFVSLVSLVLILLPAHTRFSVDAWRDERIARKYVPRFTINILRVMLGIVYFYAGLAKVNSDWLLHAQPLSIWLPAKNDLPLIGTVLGEKWVAYLFSWFGCIYDLSIPFLLSFRLTRLWAYCTVIVFHVLTAWLFPIGVFPWVMIVSTLIFFPASFFENLFGYIRVIIPKFADKGLGVYRYGPFSGRVVPLFLCFFLFVQLLFPLRYVLYPGELFWTEEGYRFSWRVMLMEKSGYTQFKVVEPVSGRYELIRNFDYLTGLQEKQMSFQPDMILQFAHYVAGVYRKKGWQNPQVYVESYVSLNGRKSRPFIDKNVDLAARKESWKHKTWILPFEDKIYGF